MTSLLSDKMQNIFQHFGCATVIQCILFNYHCVRNTISYAYCAVVEADYGQTMSLIVFTTTRKTIPQKSLTYSLLYFVRHTELHDCHQQVHQRADIVNVYLFHSCWIIFLQCTQIHSLSPSNIMKRPKQRNSNFNLGLKVISSSYFRQHDKAS